MGAGDALTSPLQFTMRPVSLDFNLLLRNCRLVDSRRNQVIVSSPDDQKQRSHRMPAILPAFVCKVSI